MIFRRALIISKTKVKWGKEDDSSYPFNNAIFQSKDRIKNKKDLANYLSKHDLSHLLLAEDKYRQLFPKEMLETPGFIKPYEQRAQEFDLKVDEIWRKLRDGNYSLYFTGNEGRLQQVVGENPLPIIRIDEANASGLMNPSSGAEVTSYADSNQGFIRMGLRMPTPISYPV